MTRDQVLKRIEPNFQFNLNDEFFNKEEKAHVFLFKYNIQIMLGGKYILADVEFKDILLLEVEKAYGQRFIRIMTSTALFKIAL